MLSDKESASTRKSNRKTFSRRRSGERKLRRVQMSDGDFAIDEEDYETLKLRLNKKLLEKLTAERERDQIRNLELSKAATKQDKDELTEK